MKIIIAVCLCVLVAAVANADFLMPESVYRMDQLGEAKTEAGLNKRAITIIYTHEKTTCGLCKAASLKSAETLGKETVVVYANADTEWGKLPSTVQQALSSPASGRFVPKTIILDSQLTTVFAIVPYADSEKYDELLSDAIKKLPAVP